VAQTVTQVDDFYLNRRSFSKELIINRHRLMKTSTAFMSGRMRATKKPRHTTGLFKG